jgi:hypothetical protein
MRFSGQPQSSGWRSFAGTCGNALIGVEAAALPMPGEEAGPADPAAESPRGYYPLYTAPAGSTGSPFGLQIEKRRLQAAANREDSLQAIPAGSIIKTAISEGALSDTRRDERRPFRKHRGKSCRSGSRDFTAKAEETKTGPKAPVKAAEAARKAAAERKAAGDGTKLRKAGDGSGRGPRIPAGKPIPPAEGHGEYTPCGPPANYIMLSWAIFA